MYYYYLGVHTVPYRNTRKHVCKFNLTKALIQLPGTPEFGQIFWTVNFQLQPISLPLTTNCKSSSLFTLARTTHSKTLHIECLATARLYNCLPWTAIHLDPFITPGSNIVRSTHNKMHWEHKLKRPIKEANPSLSFAPPLRHFSYLRPFSFHLHTPAAPETINMSETSYKEPESSSHQTGKTPSFMMHVGCTRVVSLCNFPGPTQMLYEHFLFY